jgi:hypothetical protein
MRRLTVSGTTTSEVVSLRGICRRLYVDACTAEARKSKEIIVADGKYVGQVLQCKRVDIPSLIIPSLSLPISLSHVAFYCASRPFLYQSMPRLFDYPLVCHSAGRKPIICRHLYALGRSFGR